MIAADGLPITLAAIVAVFPSDQPVPLLIILIVGVEEPSTITSAVAPEEEPPVIATFLYVPGVPPVPPAMPEIVEIPFEPAD